MILGFVSFILALTVEFGANIPHDLFMAFEWAHFLIFACAMLYVANALLASVRTPSPPVSSNSRMTPAYHPGAHAPSSAPRQPPPRANWYTKCA
jgi:hypothetical protein